jgi:hypothetical protein
MAADPANSADSHTGRTDSGAHRVPDWQAPRTGDDDLLAANLQRTWEYVSGRSLPPDVRLDQLSEEELIGFWADDVEPTSTVANGQVCAMLAFDIQGFTRLDRDEEVRIYIRKALYEIMQQALKESGVPWDRCHHGDRGDGALIVLPSSIPVHGIINPFPERLRRLIRVHNRMSFPAAQFQIRVAAHIGPVYRDDHGLIGDDINLLFRMLDARLLRTALAGSGAELALALSGYLYDSFVRRHPALTGPALFRPMNTTVKGMRINAWIHIPGVPPQLAPPMPRPVQGLAA